MFKYAGVNPCAEEPLPAGGSCLLGAINLSEFVDNPFTKNAAFNIPEFKKAVKIGIKALNDVLDEGLEKHPLQIQRDTVKKWRQIGLGIMGFADALVKLKIPYGSGRSLNLIDQIGKAMVNAGIIQSAELAKEFGPFEEYNESVLMDSIFLNSTCTEYTKNIVKKNKLRNSQLFTIAPTGSISTMLQVSGGVEPIFSYDYTRTTKSLNGGQEKTYKVVTPIFVEALQHCTYTESLPDYITWSSKLNPIDRVKTQGTWQKWIDASISSTVNLPNDATIEDVRNIYLKAWAYGCKGITIYRSGCAREGILKETKEEKPEPVIQPQISKPIDTDIEHCTALGTKLETGCGSLWITAYFHNETGQLCHLFLDKGSKGGCNSFMIGLSRTISMLGKMGVSIEDIADQLLSVTPCPSYVLSKSKNGNVSSGKCCPDAVGRALQDLQNKFINSKVEYEAPQVLTLIDDDDVISENACPECGSQLINTGGCNICQNCGWSKCM